MTNRATGRLAKRIAKWTSVAQMLGMRRSVLFDWLQDEGWLHREADGWRATSQALDREWVVMRGSESIAWPQITPNGQREIAHRLGLGACADSAA